MQDAESLESKGVSAMLRAMSALPDLIPLQIVCCGALHYLLTSTTGLQTSSLTTGQQTPCLTTGKIVEEEGGMPDFVLILQDLILSVMRRHGDEDGLQTVAIMALKDVIQSGNS